MQKTQPNTISLLFTNGETARIVVHLHKANRDKTRPADAYMVTGGGLSQSARRAAEAVYNWLQQTQKNPDWFVAGFDLENSSNSTAGQSGGLAFAVALAAEILNLKGLHIAATGEIAPGHASGNIQRVEGINEKLAGAADSLPDGGMVFYPRANSEEIRADTLELYQQKNIVSVAVATIAEALEQLTHQGSAVPWKRDARVPTKRQWKSVVTTLLIAVALSAGTVFAVLYFSKGNIPSGPKLIHQPLQSTSVHPRQELSESNPASKDPAAVLPVSEPVSTTLIQGEAAPLSADDKPRQERTDPQQKATEPSTNEEETTPVKPSPGIFLQNNRIDQPYAGAPYGFQ